MPRGFSLVEVTIAAAVIGLMIIAAAVLLNRIPVSGRDTRDGEVALAIAHNKLEALRGGGYSALSSGAFTDPLLASLPQGTASTTVSDYTTKTKRANVIVSWRGSDGVLRSISLTTLLTSYSTLP